ncbi:MAG: cytochrome o ubiquinol oxidase subunit IV [Pseudomonadota bacterium]|jgi:cytochrome o ubiquinol oxidase operon protein cyoD|nr:MAG: cytochrome o ubiquinol oxidase subunit IV [Pseudomonadota bacterium]
MSTHAHEELQGAEGFTLRTYLTGFVLCAVLTALPFWIVMTGAVAPGGAAKATVVAFAVAQIIVQTVTFLHVNARAQGGWTLLAYVFTAVLLVITIAGSIWIMYHLNLNMMPGMMHAPASGQMP